MKKTVFTIWILVAFCTLACEEDETLSGIGAPTLEARGIQADRFSFAITVGEEQSNGKLYFMAQEADKPSLSAQEIVSNRFATSINLNGSTFKTASMPGLKSKTDYTVYAVIAIGEKLGKVASLSVATL